MISVVFSAIVSGEEHCGCMELMNTSALTLSPEFVRFSNPKGIEVQQFTCDDCFRYFNYMQRVESYRNSNSSHR